MTGGNKMAKYCPGCKQILQVSNFHKNKNRKDGLHCHCKQCAMKYSQKYYFQHKNERLRYAKQYRKKLSSRIRSTITNLKSNGCAICGYDKCIRALHFHHVNRNEKKFQICQTSLYKYNDNIMIDELNKCILLCCNCHGEIEGIKRR